MVDDGHLPRLTSILYMTLFDYLGNFKWANDLFVEKLTWLRRWLLCFELFTYRDRGVY